MPNDSANSDSPFEDFRSYLTLLARAGLGTHLQAKMDASDVVQQTLLEAYQASGQFRGNSMAERAVWLRQILRAIWRPWHATSAAKNGTSSASSRLSRFWSNRRRISACGWPTATSSPSQKAQREESAVRVALALNALSHNQREAVVLRHFEGRSLTEIGAALGCSTAAVAGLIYRGLKVLRRQLQEQE